VEVGGGLRESEQCGPKLPLTTSAITCLYRVQFESSVWHQKQSVPRSQIATRSTATLHCGDETCLSVKILERSRNRNHGIAKEVCGSWWWIAGVKGVWIQTTLGSFRNHVLIYGPCKSGVWQQKQGVPRSRIATRSTATLHCGDRKCSNAKILERSRN